MRLLLTTLNSKYIHQNLAVGLLYELYKSEYQVEAKEFTIKTPVKEIVAHSTSFDVVAFSCYIWNITQTLTVAKAIKEQNPQCKILLGGPEVSFEWEEIMALPYVDFIIVNEGEEPLGQFLKHYPILDQVGSLVWKSGSEVVENKPAQVFNLEKFRGINPYLFVPTEELKHKVCYVEATRGCPNRCSFCLAGLDNRVRYLPQEHVHNNLLYLMQHGRVIKFLDRTFNANPTYAIGIFQFILDHYKPGNVFQFEIKADALQLTLIEFVRNNVPKGLFRFEIGIQTLNKQANEETKRRQNFENITFFVEQVSHLVELHLDLIVGLPYDYFEDIKYSFEEVFKLFAPELQLGFLKFLKGTPIRAQYQQHNYQFDPAPPYQITESQYLSSAELQRLETVEHALAMYWNKKRACNALRYVATRYSSFDFLEGVGMQWEQVRKKNTLLEMYEALTIYVKERFSHDAILLQLIALDYYLNHKIKPSPRVIAELEGAERQQIIAERGLNQHKFRYAIHHVSFNVKEFLLNQQLIPSKDILIVQFSGTAAPVVVY